MFKRVIFGDVANEKVAALRDLKMREYLVMAVLAILVLLLGLFPGPLLEVMRTSVEHLIDCNLISKLSAEGMCS